MRQRSFIEQPHVLFCQSDAEGAWLATEDLTLLELGLSKGLKLPFSC
jgi:hypothetical protein